MTGRRVAPLIGLVGVWLALMGFLGGMAVERIRFDQHRTSVLNRLRAAESRLHERLMAVERASAAP